MESDSSEIVKNELISIENLIVILNKAIKGLELRNYISESEIRSFIRIKEKRKKKPYLNNCLFYYY